MKKIVILLVMFASFSITKAQSTYDEYIEDQLIDYSLLLKYKDSIKLSASQLTSIKDFYASTGFNFEEKTSAYRNALAALQKNVESDASRSAVMNAFNEVLTLENEIKRNRLKFLLHSREILDDKQRNTLRLIGRGNSLVVKSGPEGVLNGYFLDIKPIYKLVDKDNNVTYVREGMLNQIDASQIKTIDVQKGVDLTIEGEQLRNQNVITIITEEKFGKEKTSIYVRGNAREVSDIGDPLIIIFHEGKTQKIRGKANETFKDLDPSDIKSITVLKGESATALYGSDAEAGVVEVHLKKESKYEIK